MEKPGKELFCVLFFTWTSKSLPVGDPSSQDRTKYSKAAPLLCSATSTSILPTCQQYRYSANRPRNVRRSTLCPVTPLFRFLLRALCKLTWPPLFLPRGERYAAAIRKRAAHLVSASNRIALRSHHSSGLPSNQPTPTSYAVPSCPSWRTTRGRRSPLPRLPSRPKKNRPRTSP